MNWTPVYLSLKIATISVVFTFLIGTALAALVTQKYFRGKHLLDTLISLPLVLPPVVTGFALLTLFGRIGLHSVLFTPAAAIIASTIVSIPLMYQSAKTAFTHLNPKLMQAAATLGASPSRTFKSIVLPLSWTTLSSGILLSFARALGEFGATIMVAGNIPGRTQTMALAIYASAEENDLATAGMYVLILSVIAFVVVYSLGRQGKTAQQ